MSSAMTLGALLALAVTPNALQGSSRPLEKTMLDAVDAACVGRWEEGGRVGCVGG
jgi:hypothetical protein